MQLFDGSASGLKEVSAGHTFFLEELGLEPGDFVSYYARATDRNLAQANRDVKSDLYFVQIRAFSRDFRMAQSQGGAMGGAGGGAGPLGGIGRHEGLKIPFAKASARSTARTSSS